MGKFKDLTGLKFGKLTVIEQAGHDKYNKILWKCKCDCGKETITHGRDLVNGHCKSCGCLLIEKIKENYVLLKVEERKKGHWILLDECANSGYYCSECHKKVVKEGWSNTVKKIKYCPNCGSTMDGEIEEVEE